MLVKEAPGVQDDSCMYETNSQSLNEMNNDSNSMYVLLYWSMDVIQMEIWFILNMFTKQWHVFALGKHCCRDASQISEQLGHSEPKYRSLLETW